MGKTELIRQLPSYSGNEEMMQLKFELWAAEHIRKLRDK